MTLYDPKSTVHLPQFKLQLCLDEGGMQFFPSVPDLEQAVLFPVHTVTSTMQKVPVVQVSTMRFVAISVCVVSTSYYSSRSTGRK